MCVMKKLTHRANDPSSLSIQLNSMLTKSFLPILQPLEKGRPCRFYQRSHCPARAIFLKMSFALPDPELYYKGGGPDLKTLDAGFDKNKPRQKIDLAFQAEERSIRQGRADYFSNSRVLRWNERAGDGYQQWI